MKVKVIDTTGKSISEKELDKAVFGVEVKDSILSQYVFAFLSNQRQGNAHTKDRSEVRGGGKKPWRQKGTGRARFGSSRNPLWRGGGVAFGPTNARNWKKTLTKKFKKAATRNALSKRAGEGAIFAIESLDKFKSAKSPAKSVANFVNKVDKGNKVVIIADEYDKDVIKAFSNVTEAQLINIGELNTYEILNAGKLVFTSKALDIIKTKYGK